jgi:aryl-alcohol dehydrogenase-like predicted oxidoreductase
MYYRALGASGLNVPVIGLGTANFRVGENPAHGIDESTAARLVDIAIERGAAFLDTGDIYGGAEEVLGRILAGRRARALVATKAGLRSGSDANDTGASRHHLIAACEASLRRLGTDHIDLFQLHSFDGRTPMEETLSTLDDLIRAGKVRYVGCSNHAAWQLMKALATSDRFGWARYVAHQISYSLANRDVESELLPLGHDQQVASLVWSPLAGGVLSGRYGRAGLPLSALPFRGGALRAVPEEQLLDIIDSIVEVAHEAGASPAQIALAWLLGRPTVATLFVGASSTSQFEASLEAIDLRLDEAQRARLDAASARPPAYPYWHQQSVGGERIVSVAGLPAPTDVRVDRQLPIPKAAE